MVLRTFKGSRFSIKILKIEYFLFFLPLFGMGFPAYLWALLFIVLKFKSLKFTRFDFFFLILILTFFFIKLGETEIVANLTLFRYYFGFYVFYLYFKCRHVELDFEKLLLFIFIVICLEALLINTVIDPTVLPNYPPTAEEDVINKTFMNFYKRPYSIGNNASITGTLIIAILFYAYSTGVGLNQTKLNTIFYLSFLSILLLASGTGLMLLILFLIYRLKPFKNIVNSAMSVLLVALLYYVIFKTEITNFDDFDKISSIYFDFLIEFKSQQIEDVLAKMHHGYQYLIGIEFENKTEIVTWSDFAWNNLFECFGIIGVLLTLAFLFVKANKYSYLPVCLFVIGAFHYAGMYALPGQLFLGYILANKSIYFNNIENKRISY